MLDVLNINLIASQNELYYHHAFVIHSVFTINCRWNEAIIDSAIFDNRHEIMEIIVFPSKFISNIFSITSAGEQIKPILQL